MLQPEGELRCLPYKREITNYIMYTTQFNIFCLFNWNKPKQQNDDRALRTIQNQAPQLHTLSP
ncbi:hypothetical protein CR513_52340, partial [Mucuna pruriens]